MPYNFIEHPADIAVEVEAYSIEELFSLSCYAWREAVLKSNDVILTNEKVISLHAESNEELLVRFLSELNFFLYTKHWIFNSLKTIKFTEEKKSLKLFAEILVEPLDENIHVLKEEIKAVTFHQMKIENINGIFKTRIIFDI